MFKEVTCRGVTFMTAENITVTHAFTTRLGGVSSGVFKSLNLGENRGDEKACVLENYKRLKEALNLAENFVFTNQVHETDVIRVTHTDARELFSLHKFTADGLITNEPDLPLIIFTADCIPILFFDPVRRAVGASHAGWRGTVKDIAGKTVRRMAEEFGSDPKDIRAAIGPGIGLCCFETGPEVPEAFREILGKAADKFIRPAAFPQKFMADLKGINRALLIKAGVNGENIAVSDECTMCLHEKYWSHRHTGGIRGSQASVITLKGSRM